MAVVTVRNLPDEVYRALKVRAAQHNRSTEAEIREILDEAVRPPERIRMGGLLASIGRRFELQDEDVALFQRDRIPAKPVSLD